MKTRQKNTDLDAIKRQTVTIAHALPLHPTEFGIAINPFIETVAWYVPDPSPAKTELLLLTEPENFQKWLKWFSGRVEQAASLLEVYLMWRSAWKLTFMKYCGPYMSAEDFAHFLADSWVTEDNPNMDVNVPLREAVRMFRKADKRFLMTAEDLEKYQALPEEVEIYRGVGRNRAERGLSWTDDRQKAEWFMRRFDSFGRSGDEKLLKARVEKKDILAYFNTRREKEVLCDVFKLKDITVL